MKKFLLSSGIFILILFVSTNQLLAQEIWGTAAGGGDYGGGTLFKTDINGDNMQVMHSFNPSTDGRFVLGITQASNGKIYGLANYGGLHDNGTIFMFEPSSNQFTKIFDFDGTAGSQPIGYLVEASNGLLYCTTHRGGAVGQGALIEVDPATNTVTKRADFGSGNQSINPGGTLVEWNNGIFLGTTTQSVVGPGSLFRFDSNNGQINTLTSFNGSNGAHPYYNLVKAANGKFYGLTVDGGVYGSGVVFEFDPSSGFSKKRDFDPNNLGRRPFGGLVEWVDGRSLYGMTFEGGSANMGTIFIYDPVGNGISKRIDFYGGNGSHPIRNLTLTPDGTFIGVTRDGGQYNQGVLFTYNPANNLFVKKIDFEGGIGINPQSTLIVSNCFPSNIQPDVASLPDINADCEVSSLIPPIASNNCGEQVIGTTDAVLPIAASTTIIWTYDDGNGNTTTQTQNVIIDDITPPDITCADVTVSTGNENCEAEVAVPTPVVSDNCEAISGALDFDGNNDYVEIQNFPFLSDFTLEAWVNPIYIPSEGYRAIVSKGAVFDSNTNYSFGLRHNWRNGEYTLYLYVQNGSAISGYAAQIVSSSNTWTHVAASFDESSKTVVLYQNGLIIGSSQLTVVPGNGGQSLRIGYPASTDGQDEPFTGQISDIRIWSRNLSETEIAASYDKILSGLEPGLEAYFNFDDGTGSNTLADHSSNGNSGVLTNMDVNTDWITSGSLIKPFSLTNNVTGTSDASGTYPLGETEVVWTATDVKGNSSTCTSTITVEDNTSPVAIAQNLTVELDANGQATITPEQVNNGSTDNCEIESLSLSKSSFDCSDVNLIQNSASAVSFPGNGEYVQFGSSPVLKVSSALSVEAWVYPTAYHPNGGIIVSREGEYELAIYPDGTFRWAIANSNPGWAWVNSTKTIPLNQWSHITFVYNGLDAKLYINGNWAFSYGTFGPIGDYHPIQNDFRIGDRQLGGQPFIGRIDEVRVWNTVLSETKIHDQYNKKLVGSEPGLQGYWSFDEGIGLTTVDKTSNGNNGTLVNPSAWVSPGAPLLTNEHLAVLTVTDASGNSSTANAIITVEDNLPPDIIGQDITVTLTASGTVSIAPEDVLVNGSDNCTPVTYSLSQSVFDVNDALASPVTVDLTGTDEHGNSTIVPVQVTVFDPVPTAIAQDITVYLDGSGNVVISPDDVDNGSNSVVGIANKSLDMSAFACENIGANIVSLVVESTLGSMDTALATVTVNDTIKPVVVTKDITVYLDASGNMSIAADSIDDGSSDACGIQTYETDITDFDCSNVGAVPVVLTVTDVNGNVQTAPATVTVIDTVKPVVQTKDITVYLDATGNMSIAADSIDDGSSDACGIQTYATDITDFDCSDVGAVPVVLTVTDVNGNVQTAPATVTVIDTVKPLVITKDITVYLDASGNMSIAADSIDDGSNDACGILTYETDITDFDCSDVGDVPVILTVTDVNGNIQTAPATVTVIDTVKPVVQTKDITLYLDATGNMSIAADSIDDGSSDACGIQTYETDITDFDCSDVGAVPVVLTVTDVNGNVQAAPATVTVIDTVKPVVQTKDITVYLDATG
ncbi:choice-of-anchor tandem repeat GloVer-containing protein, partial [Maribellus sediminis]|uniref:choice-of-anchor tandem repeat GloVer-containing protein n=1 Tax=Maribellus sediminis TaxID=2696285 RepID=UPI00197CE9A0